MQETAPENPSQTPKHTTAIEDKVPLLQKVTYGMGTTLDMWGNWLYPGLVWPVFNIFLGVPPWLISLALCMNRLVDAFADPFIGWMSVNTRSRWGRRRPYILIGSLLAGIGLPGLVWVTPGWGSSHIFGTEIPHYFWYMAASSALYIVCVSLYNVPYQSLGAELTPDARERTSLFSYRTAIQRIPELAMFTAAAFSTSKVWSGATKDDVMDRLGLMASRTSHWFGELFASLASLDLSKTGTLMGNIFGWGTPMPGDAPVNTLLGAQVYTIGLGCIMVVVGIFVFLVVKERYYNSVVERNQEKVEIGETIWKTLKCRPFRANLTMGFAYAMGTSMVGTLGYYATVYFVCKGDVSVGSLWNTLMGLANSFIGVLGVPVFAFLSYRLGKRGGMMCVQLSAMAVFVATWWLYTPDIVWLQVFASGLIAFTGSGFWMLYGSIGADIIDYDELEHGKRREGAFTSSGMWIMKVGQALGIGCSGIVLSATGFNAALGGNQTAEAIFNIRLYLAAIPVVGLIIALAFLSRYGLTDKKVAEIRTQLEARRGKV